MEERKNRRGRPKGSKNKPKSRSQERRMAAQELTQEQKDQLQDVQLAKGERKGRKLPAQQKNNKGIGRYLTCPLCDATMLVYFPRMKLGESKTVNFNCEKCNAEHAVRGSAKLVLQSL